MYPLETFREITENNNRADVALQSKDGRHAQSSMGQMSSQCFLRFIVRASFYLLLFYIGSLLFFSHSASQSLDQGEHIISQALVDVGSTHSMDL